MTDIEQKAQALILKAQGEYPNCDPYTAAVLVLERSIEAHEATEQKLHDFRQEVSDQLTTYGFINTPIGIGRFVIPAPKPDPLVEVLEGLEDAIHETVMANAKAIRAALDDIGLEIREKGNDQ